MKIGVLALQGAFIEHINVLKRLEVAAEEVRLADQLGHLGGLIIPGGESTTIINLMHCFDIFSPLKRMAQGGFPVMGTCAGMICLAKKVSNSDSIPIGTLGLMDIEVRRNAFGRQVDSFETDLSMPALGDRTFHAVFIRAPFIEKTGPQVEVLARLPDGTVVASRQGNMVATSFHPELTDDFRLHEYFLNIVSSRGELKNREVLGKRERVTKL